MITKFTDRFVAKRDDVEAQLLELTVVPSYKGLVQRVIEVISAGDEYDGPDPNRITCIDHGDYQGTQVFVIGAKDYQPTDYWFVKVSYGSCSGCDTLCAISEDGEYGEKLNQKQVNGLWTLMLHIAQGLKPMQEE